MRSLLLKSCLTLMLALTTACGGAPEADAPEAPSTGTNTQAVLYPPPAPASGNILDSTTYMGPVAVPGAVQTQFTTNPQYFSFSFQAFAGSQVKLEVTHLGSSMYLDTGLFVYGPRQADGSYGTTLLANDDDAGYGQLSKVASLNLAQGGEYLVVVSAGAGAGKKFRLQLDCLSGVCQPQVAPEDYALEVQEEALTPTLVDLSEKVYWACEGACNGWLHAYNFPWPYEGLPTMDMAVRPFEASDRFWQYGYQQTEVFPFAELDPKLIPALSAWGVPQEVLTTYSNGTEDVQVAAYASPVQGSDFKFFVILFPESRKVFTIEQEHFW